MKKQVTIYTDGACSGNPGPGGWGAILMYQDQKKELSGFEPVTTNNRMELMGVIQGLEALKRPTAVELVSDSTYVLKGLSEWLPKWKANDWKRRERDRWVEVKNEDLWRRLDQLRAKHRIHVTHIRGHAGHVENERCDALAVAAYQQYRK